MFFGSFQDKSPATNTGLARLRGWFHGLGVGGMWELGTTITNPTALTILHEV